MDAVYSTIEQYFGNYIYPIIYLCCIAVGVIIGKGIRKTFIFPSILIIAFVLNPVLKDIVDRSDAGNVYWRALWLIPIIPVMATIPVAIVDRVNSGGEIRTIITIIAIFGMTGVIMVFGAADKTIDFVDTQNADKLPEDVVSIAEVLLELDDHPRTVSDVNISTYLRQYSGKIQSPYSRSISYGYPSDLGKKMYGYLTSGEYSELAQEMENHDYAYLVTDNSSEDKRTVLEVAGYELLEQVNRYGIYQVHGNRTEIRKYNAKGQLSSLTYVDPEGKPIVQSSGYASITLEYDIDGRVNYEFHLDNNGNGVADSQGVAGFRYERNRLGQVTKKTYIGTDGEPVKNGRAYCLYTYGKNKQLIHESYYDVDEMPVNVDAGYAEIRYEYEGDQLSLSYYLDAEGNSVNCGSSYFHEYLNGLRELIQADPDRYVVFFSIKDEGTDSLTITLQNDLYDLGIKKCLLDQFRTSYYAVITGDKTIEDMSMDVIQRQGSIGEHEYVIVSGGNNNTGNISSIIIDGVDYSKNARGMNIVIYDLAMSDVIDSVRIDTFSPMMLLTR